MSEKSSPKTIEERIKEADKESKNFIEQERQKYREFVLTLNYGIEMKTETWLGE